MKFRGMLVAVALLAALGVGVYFSNKAKEAEEKKKDSGTPDAPKILNIPEDQITQIEIRKTGQPPTVLKKTDKWQIAEPAGLPADTDAISPLVSSVSSLNSDRLVEEKVSDWAPYGLAAPQLEVTVVSKDGKKRKLSIGDETPTGSGNFARLEGDPRLFSIASYNKTSLDKTANDLRDKRLVIFDSEKLTRLELAAKGQSMEFGKNPQNEWQIVKPRPLRADNYQVEEIIRKIKDAKMDTALAAEDARKAAAAFASGSAVAVAKVTDAAGTHQLEIRKNKEDYYAKGSAVEGAYKVSNDIGTGLDKPLEELRNKKLYDFGFSDVTKVEVTREGKTAVYEKKGEKWMQGAQEMDSVSVQSFIDRLRDLSSIKFVDSGFATPIFQATVTAKEGKLVEKVSISKSGNSYFAKRENEPSVYELAASAVEDLQKVAGEVKANVPAKDGKKDQKK